jgi:hypothetical protein
LNPTAHTIHNADLLAHLRGNRWLVQNGYIPKSHAILCDPPYGLAFMGKEWDTLGAVEFQAWVTEWAGLLIDYVHPGALGLFFGGTRTYHRLAAGLEDAGWEVTDCIMWVHGQGFPKSASIGKLLDKEAGAAREVVGKSARHVSGKPEQRTAGLNGSSTFAETIGMGGTITAPATPLAARWEGYGTALKPAFEPVVVARAPRGKRTYAALAREFGTGALAIDAARIGTAEDLARPFIQRFDNQVYGKGLGAGVQESPAGRWPANFALVCTCESDDHAADCPTAILGRQSGVTSSTPNPRNNGEFKSVAKGYETPHVTYGHEDRGTAARFFYTAKAAAWEREAGLHGFAKRAMREPGAEFGKMTMWNGENGDEAWRAKNPNNPRANVHPTVKPIRLAEYLARLILPPEGDGPRRLLVPFAGSGSEMIGALLEGWDVVTGIEREAEYVDLARARVGWWAQFATYDEARAAYEQERQKVVRGSGRRGKDDYAMRYEVLTCPEHGAVALKKAGDRRYACGCKLQYGKREQPAPVVIDEKPYTLPMLILEAVNA